jgi:hypothetical protein
MVQREGAEKPSLRARRALLSIITGHQDEKILAGESRYHKELRLSGDLAFALWIIGLYGVFDSVNLLH